MKSALETEVREKLQYNANTLGLSVSVYIRRLIVLGLECDKKNINQQTPNKTIESAVIETLFLVRWLAKQQKNESVDEIIKLAHHKANSIS